MVIGGHVIVFCGPRYHCPDCKAKRKNFGRHCSVDVVAITKTCRQLHFETSLLPLKLNTFCGQAQDLYITIDRYFWTKVELDAIKSIWAVDGGRAFYSGFNRLGGLTEVIVSATKEVCAGFGGRFREFQGQIMVENMERELGVYGRLSSGPKVQFLSEEEQGELPGIAWELSPTSSGFVCRRCGTTGHWIQDCTNYRFFGSLAWFIEFATGLRQQMRG